MGLRLVGEVSWEGLRPVLGCETLSVGNPHKASFISCNANSVVIESPCEPASALKRRAISHTLCTYGSFWNMEHMSCINLLQSEDTLILSF